MGFFEGEGGGPEGWGGERERWAEGWNGVCVWGMVVREGGMCPLLLYFFFSNCCFGFIVSIISVLMCAHLIILFALFR